MTAIDDLIADIAGAKYSDGNQNLIAKIDVAVAALLQIQASILPSGTQSANTFFAGPASGVPAAPGFRALGNADFGVKTLSPNFLGLVGSTAGDNAPAGDNGEFFSAQVLSSAPIAMTNATPVDIVTLPLGAGDYDVWGNFFFSFSGANGATCFAALNTAATTFPDASMRTAYTGVPLNSFGGPLGSMRSNSNAAVTIHLVGQGNFAAGTLGGSGYIMARRRR